MSNRTQRYLSPSIKLREESFQKLLGDLNKENYYAMDSDYYQAYGLTEVKNYLFVQIDLLGFFNFESKCYINSTEYSLKTYKESLDKIKEFSFFVANYKLKANKFKEILIFELPEVKLKGKIINTVENFLLGKYSELWTKEQLEVMFKPIAGDTSSNYIQNENKRREEVKAVLSKDPRYKYLYVDYIKEKFGTVLNESEVSDDIEFDIPVKLDCKEEILGDSNILFQVGVLELKDIKKPQTVTNEDLV